MSTAADFTKKTFALITGASRGIGRQIAVDLSSKLHTESCLILIARSLEGLQETKRIIQSKNPLLNIEIIELDLSKPHEEAYKQIVAEIFSKQIKYDNVLIFHNAGQVGSLQKAVTLSNLELWNNYYITNVFSTIMLNNIFVTEAKKYCDGTLYVINISSLCGYKPFENMAMYGSAKAARDLYFSVLDVEEPVIVLKYCPGPVKTDMVGEIVDKAESSNLRKQFKDMIDGKTILTTDQTVKKLLRILEEGKFKSGDRIDYYDDM